MFPFDLFRYLKTLSQRPRVKTIVKKPRFRLRLEELESRLAPAGTFTWTGAGGNDLWSTPGNWSSSTGGAPTGTLDSLVFGPAGASQTTSINNIANGTYTSIAFSANGYQITPFSSSSSFQITLGGPLTGGTITVNALTQNIDLGLDIVFAANAGVQETITVGTAGSIELSGRLFGVAGLQLTGAGTLILSGNNTGFTGPVLLANNAGTAGVLQIQHASALGGANGSGNYNTVTVENSTQLQVNIPTGTIRQNLLLGGTGGDTTGALLNLGGTATTGPTWAGNVNMEADTTIGAANNTFLNITGVVTSNSLFDLTKRGDGTIALSNANTYTGNTFVNDGILEIRNPLALGNGDLNQHFTTTVGYNAAAQEQGTLQLNDPTGVGFDVLNEILVLNGPGHPGTNGALYNLRGNNSWGSWGPVAGDSPVGSGPVQLGNNPAPVSPSIGVAAGTFLTINSVISDPVTTSQLTKRDAGTLVFTNANTYDNDTLVAEGTLEIKDSRALGAIQVGSFLNATTVNNGATLKMSVDALPDSITGNTTHLVVSELLTINGDGFGDVGALYSHTGINTWTVEVVNLGAGIGVDLPVAPVGAPYNYSIVGTGIAIDDSLTISGEITFSAQLNKLLPGLLYLPNANDNFSGDTEIREGVVAVGNNTSLARFMTDRTLNAQPEITIEESGALHLLPLSATPVNEIQVVTVSNATAGTFTLTFNGQTTAPIAYNAPASSGTGNLRTIIGNLTNINAADILVVRSISGSTTTYTITFQGAFANQFVATLWANGTNLIGTGATVSTAVTRGGSEGFLNLTNKFDLIGTGALSSYGLVDEQGAIMNLSGINSISGNIFLQGQVGIGVEQIYSAGTTDLTYSGNYYSELTTTGEMSQSAAPPAIAVGGVASGGSDEDVQVINVGSSSAVLTFTGDALFAEDDFRLYLGDFATNGMAGCYLWYDSSGDFVSANPTATSNGTSTVVVNYTATSAVITVTTVIDNGSDWYLKDSGTTLTYTTPLAPTFLSLVVNQGGGQGGTVWDYTATIDPQATIDSGAGIDKLGSQRLIVQGPAIYTGEVNIKEGVLRAQSSTALGTFPDGLLESETIVFAGASLELASSVAELNGGLASGLQILNEKLTLNGSGNFLFGTAPLVNMTGNDLANDPTYLPGDTNLNDPAIIGVPLAGDTMWRGPVTLNTYASILSVNLGAAGTTNALTSPSATGGLTVTTSGLGVAQSIVFGGTIAAGDTFTLRFNGVTSAPIPWSFNATTMTNNVRAALNALSTIGIGNSTVAAVGPSGGYGEIDIRKGTRLTIDGPIDDATNLDPNGSDLTLLATAGGPPLLGLTGVPGTGSAELFLVGQNTYRGVTSVPDGLALVAGSSQALGSPGINQVQTLTLAGASSAAGNPTKFTLTFNGFTSTVITYTGINATDTLAIRAALLALPSIAGTTVGGNVDVVPGATPATYTIILRGNLVGFHQPLVTAAITSGPGASTSALISDGSGGTIVADGATLSLSGNITIGGEPVILHGRGLANTPNLPQRWVQLGPAPVLNSQEVAGNSSVTGRVTSVAVDPSDPSGNTIYVTAADGGAWKTQDGGQFWQPLFDFFSTSTPIFAGSIAIDPNDPRVLYLGTGEANNSSDSFAGTGVYKSTDFGKTWTLLVDNTVPASTSLIHDYQLNASFADALGGPDLVPIGGSLNATNYTWAEVPSPAKEGLTLSNALPVGGDHYSIEMVFQFDTIPPNRTWARILEFKNLGSDIGLYALNSALDFWPIATGPNGVFSAGTDVHFVLTRDRVTDRVIGYIDGSQQFSFIDTGDDGVFDAANNIIHFFIDDIGSAFEDDTSGGAVDYIRIYSAPLNTAQVRDLFNGGSGVGGSNPLDGAAISKIIVDPTSGTPGVASSRIYVAASDRAIHGGQGGAGVWRYDNGDWFCLTDVVSDLRENGSTVVPAPKDFPDQNGILPPNSPGPDDEWRLSFDGVGAVYSDLALVNGILYMAHAHPLGDFSNAVYRCVNPDNAADSGSNRPVWYIGDGNPFVNGETDYNAGGDDPYPTNVGGTLPRNSNIKLTAARHVLPNGVVVTYIFAVNTQLPIQYERPSLFQNWGYLDVQVSRDGGVTWAAAGNPPGGDFQDANPASVARQGVYSSTILTRGNDGDTIYLAGTSKIYRSIDSGVTWIDITNTNSPHWSYHSMSLDPQNRLVVATDGGVWRYDPTANIWSNLNGNLQITQFHSVAADPSNLHVAIGGSQTNGIQRYDGNLPWSYVGVGTAPVPTNGGQVGIDPKDPNIVYQITDGRLYQSLAAGALGTWNLVRTNVTSFHIDPNNHYRLLVTWLEFPSTRVHLEQRIYQPGTNSWVVIDQVRDTYSPIQPPFLYGPSPPFFPPALAAPFPTGGDVSIPETVWGINGYFMHGDRDPEVIVAGGVYQGPFPSGGDLGFPDVIDRGTNAYVPGAVYYTDGLNIDVSLNYTSLSTWRSRNLPGNLDSIVDLKVDPTNQNIAYVVRSVLGGRTIWQTTNAGQSWTDITGDLPSVPAWSIVIDPRTEIVDPIANVTLQSSITLYVGTDAGVYKATSIDGAFTNWTRVGLGLPAVQVRSVDLNLALNTLTIGTYGRGAFQLTLDSIVANGGSLAAVSGSAVWTGPVILAGGSTPSTGVVIAANGSQALQNGVAAASLNILGSISDQVADGDVYVSKKGGGNVIFSGDSTYGGITEVVEGALVVNNRHALGSPSAHTLVNPGTALHLQSNLDLEPITLNGDGIAFSNHYTGALRSIANSNTYTGTITLASNSTIGVDSGSTLTIGSGGNGTITGPFSLTKELTGKLVLANANTYGSGTPFTNPYNLDGANLPISIDGGTLIAQGVLNLQHGNALGIDNLILTVLDTTQLQIQGNIVIANQTAYVSGIGIGSTGAILNVAGNNTWRGDIVFNSLPAFGPASVPPTNVYIGANSGTTLTVDGLVTDPFGLNNVAGVPFLETDASNNTTADPDDISIPATAPLSIVGTISSAGDSDYYRFTLTTRSGVFFDIDARELGLPGNLDSRLRLYAANGTTVLEDNTNGYDFDTGYPAPIAASSVTGDSAIYRDLNPGTYFIRVTASSGTGDYQLGIRADTDYSNTIPVLNSNPGAPSTILLDFNGHSASDVWGNYTIPAFDLNGNTGELTPGEKLAIFNIWRVMAEDYSAFNINISTDYIGNFGAGLANRAVFGGTPDLVGQPAAELGAAQFGGFAAGAEPFFVFTGHASFQTTASSESLVGNALWIGNVGSHEAGHIMGLEHYGGGNPQPLGIMQTPSTGIAQALWRTGLTHDGETPAGNLQDDMAVISGSANVFGYRPDDHSDDINSATVLSSANGDSFTAQGVIGPVTEVDFFRFVAPGGSTDIRVDVDDYVNNLDVEVYVYDQNQVLIGSQDLATSFDGFVNLTLTAGETYFVEVRSDGEPGEAGEYTVTVGPAGVGGGGGGGSGLVLGLTKVGLGKLILQQDNAYGGVTTVAQGILNIQADAALGSLLNGTVVNTNAALELDGDPTNLGGGVGIDVDEFVTLNGAGIASTGALRNVSGENTWNGSVNLQTSSTIGVDTNTLLTIDGTVQDLTPASAAPAPDLVKVGEGRLVLNTTNSYRGTTFVNNGIVAATFPRSLGAVGVSEVQRVTVNSTSGTTHTYRLRIKTADGDQVTTATLNFSDSFATVQAALNAALATLDPSSTVSVTLFSSTAVSKVFQVTFQGSLLGYNQDPITFTSLSGTTVAVTTFTHGGGGTIVNSAAGVSGTLQLEGGVTITGEPLRLSGDGYNGMGALHGLSGANVWNSTIFLVADASIGAATDPAANIPVLVVNPAIGQTSVGKKLTKVGVGTLDLKGSNTYTGLTTVSDGALWLDYDNTVIPGNSILGDLAIGLGDNVAAVAKLLFSNQIPDSNQVSLASDGTFDLNDKNEIIDKLISIDGNVTTGTGATSQLTITTLANLTGGVVTTNSTVALNGSLVATSSANGPAVIDGSGVLALGAGNRSFNVTSSSPTRPVDLQITAEITGSAGLTKSGNGNLEIDNNSNAFGEVKLLAGTLSGIGAVGPVHGNPSSQPAVGTIDPGTATGMGVLTSGDVIMGANTTFNVDLDHTSAGVPIAGVDHDQLVVDGDVTLGGALLAGSVSNTVAIGDSFTILQVINGHTLNIGQLSTLIFGVPTLVSDGGHVFVDNKTFKIDYTSGVNGTVVLTRERALATVTISSSGTTSTATTGSSVYGEDIVFTVTVTPEPGATITPGTKVHWTFDDGQAGEFFTVPDIVLTAADINPTTHVATSTFNPQTYNNFTWPLGAHTIDATFYDDVTNNFNTTAAPTFTQTVSKGSVTLSTLYSIDNGATWVANPTPIYGTPVLMQITITPNVTPVTPLSDYPTGNVRFFLDPLTDNILMPAGAVDGVSIDGNQQYTLTLPDNIARGTHTIAAQYIGDSLNSYLGDANYFASAVTNFSLTVVNDSSTVEIITSGSSDLGQVATFDINVLPGAFPNSTGTPEGTVQLRYGSATNPPIAGTQQTLVNGSATITTTNLSVGSHTLFVTFVPSNGNYTASNNSVAYVVNKAPTQVTFAASTPTSSNFRQAVTFVVDVAAMPSITGFGNVTGNVRFYADGTSAGPGVIDLGAGAVTTTGPTSIRATITTTALTGGPHTIYAVYSGNANFATSTGAFGIFTVNAATTTMTLSASPSSNNAVYGQTVTFTAIVSSSVGAVVGGEVEFVDSVLGIIGYGTVGAVTPGVAKYTTDASQYLTAGSHIITANYDPSAGPNPTTNFDVSTRTLNPYLVRKASANMVVSANPALNSTYGNAVTFTAVVTALSPGKGPATNGEVNFYRGTVAPANLLGTASLTANPGEYEFTTTDTQLAAGTHNIVAAFTDDDNLLNKTVTLPNYLVNKATTQTVIDPITGNFYGAPFTITATVNVVSGGTPGIPTGTVTFRNGATTIATVPVDPSGIATFDYVYTTAASAVPAGTHNITAIYNGATSFAASPASAPESLTVTPADTTVEVISSSLMTAPDEYSSGAGVAVTFTATVTTQSPSIAIVNAGTVTFMVDAVPTATVAVNATTGKAVFTTSSLPQGVHTITARYNAPTTNSNFAGQSQDVLTQTVLKANTVTVTPTPASPAYGNDTNLTINVTSTSAPAPTGTVTIIDTFNGVPTTLLTDVSYAGPINIGVLDPGVHSIQVLYSGDTLYTPNSKTISLTVRPAVTSVSVVSSVPGTSGFGQLVTFTATVNVTSGGSPGIPTTGSVTFRNGTTVLAVVPVDGVNDFVEFQTSVLAVNLSPGHRISATYGGSNPATPSTQFFAASANTTNFVTQRVSPTATLGALSRTVGTETAPFTATIQITNGATPFTMTDFGLPPGLTASLSGRTITISGTPTAPGLFNAINIDITDNVSGLTTSRVYTITINAAPTLGTPAPTGFFKTTYTSNVAITGGTSPFTNLVVSGLPNGLTASVVGSAVRITGLPTVVGTFNSVNISVRDANGAIANGIFTIDILRAATTTRVTSNLANPTVGQSVTLKATVTSVAGIPASGGVTFYDGSLANQIGTGTVNASGIATSAPIFLPRGSHDVFAVYDGNTNFDGSTSATIPQNVTNTRMTLAADRTTMIVGQTVTFTATLQSLDLAGPPSGVVHFYDKGVLIKTINLSATGSNTSRAIFAVKLGLGSHSITAEYVSDSGTFDSVVFGTAINVLVNPLSGRSQ